MSHVAKHRGRPPREPEGEVPEYVDFAQWVVAVMENFEPRITRSQVAGRIESSDSKSGFASISTISTWLSGTRPPPEELVAAVLVLRTELGMSPEDVAMLQLRAAQHRVTCEAAVRNRQAEEVIRRMAPPGAASASVQRVRNPALTGAMNRARMAERRAESATELARKSDEFATRLYESLLDVKRELESAKQERDAALSDRVRMATQVTELRLTIIELTQRLSGTNMNTQTSAHDLSALGLSTAEFGDIAATLPQVLRREQQELLDVRRRSDELRERIERDQLEAQQREKRSEEDRERERLAFMAEIGDLTREREQLRAQVDSLRERTMNISTERARLEGALDATLGQAGVASEANEDVMDASDARDAPSRFYGSSNGSAGTGPFPAPRSESYPADLIEGKDEGSAGRHRKASPESA